MSFGRCSGTGDRTRIGHRRRLDYVIGMHPDSGVVRHLRGANHDLNTTQNTGEDTEAGFLYCENTGGEALPAGLTHFL